MILEFRVKNYRSIRDEQVLSMVASTADIELSDTHLIFTGLKSIPSAVRSSVVYGPNASGKSTLLLALNYMRAVVAESATMIQPGQTYNVQPFRLDESYINEPTEFELSFIFNGIRHQYAFAMNANRIVHESLLVYSTSKPTQWFNRSLANDGVSYEYEFSSYLTGSKKVWQDSTRDNALFLSTAAQLNSELLSPVFQWIVSNIVFIPAGATIDPSYTTAMLETEDGRALIKDFLTSADISISEIHVDSRKGFKNQVIFSDVGIPQASREESEFLVPIFEHSTLKGSAKFELHEESEGTQHLYMLVAPIFDVLKQGRILIVDELDGSLHALLVRRLISMFHDPELNHKNAQLVFSTHDTSLLDHTLFRRDQIWFTEKNADQATQVFPLSDFNPRKREAWEQGYLMGRYGAVPFFSEMPNFIRRETESI
jgi:AAA15 family ATPase/GTPase